MAKRSEGFDLREAIRSVAFTPGVRDVEPLIELLGGEDEEAAADAERALMRRGVEAARAALDRVAGAKAPLRGRLVKLVGRVAAEGAGELVNDLLRLLDDEDAKARRNAIIALGKLEGEGIESALLGKWAKEERVDHKRSIAAALGKVGGARSLALLSGLVSDDAELTRIAGEARMRLERNVSAGEESGLDLAATAERPFGAVARCRRGLEEILAGELDPAWRPSVRGPGEVRMSFGGPLAGPYRARTMLGYGFTLPPVKIGAGGAAGAIAGALSSEAARAILTTFTRGAVRYRIEWAGAGKHRAEIVRAAQTASKGWDRLVNDPSKRAWEVVVRVEGDSVSVELEPRVEDPRFGYRLGDVPAASHPTVAAALVRVAGVKANDVVWDPFAGSGTELIERALAGPWRRLVGTDSDPRAIDVAKKNLQAAKVEGAEVAVGDALAEAPEGVTLVITNPPMGRRVMRGEDVAGLMEKLVEHVARSLAPGGRMVWISPVGERTKERAKRAGMVVVEERRVDMGGFWGVLQHFRRGR